MPDEVFVVIPDEVFVVIPDKVFVVIILLVLNKGFLPLVR
jgi:hypothetical protein